jgi:hypothetical protein
MKSINHKSENNTINKYYLLMVFATSFGFAQTEKPTQETLKAKSDLSSTSAQHNPYFKNNANQGEMVSVAENNKDSIEITKQKTKSNNTNERIVKPNGQDDENPFPPKSSVSNVLKTKHDKAKNSVGNIR